MEVRDNPWPERFRRLYERYPVVFHAGGWLGFILLPSLLFTVPQMLTRVETLQLFSIRLLNATVAIGFFYFNYYRLTPALLQRRRWGRFVGLLLLTIGGMVFADLLFYRWVVQSAQQGLVSRIPRLPAELFRLGTPAPLIIGSLLPFVLLVGVSSGLAMYQDRQRQEARHQRVLLEKKEAELSALKLQISPHFLFNTLNNLRWLARQKSDQTEDAIQRLSDMLRYMIYQADRGPVALARELDYLTDYISLQRLRLAPHNRVSFETQVDDDRTLIEPLLLIHFVENAFKYGIHHQHETLIDIRLRLRDGQLDFSVANRLLEKSTEASGVGIGIQNVEKRLALHYPGRHRLRVEQPNGCFGVNLWIDLAPLPRETLQHRH